MVIRVDDCDDHSKREEISKQEKSLPEKDQDVLGNIESNELMESSSSGSDENDQVYSQNNYSDTKQPTPEETSEALEPLRNINDVLMNADSSKMVLNSSKLSAPSFKNAFVEEEADVEEDEYMNFGGADGEIEARLDRYEPEFVAEADKEVVDNYDDVIELHR